jgi:hypothetical protein
MEGCQSSLVHFILELFREEKTVLSCAQHDSVHLRRLCIDLYRLRISSKEFDQAQGDITLPKLTSRRLRSGFGCEIRSLP